MTADQIAAFLGKEEGCPCSFSHAVNVLERFKGQTVWEGTVLVFNLGDGQCFAWVDPDTDKLVMALNKPPVTSPELAVRAYVVSIS